MKKVVRSSFWVFTLLLCCHWGAEALVSTAPASTSRTLTHGRRSLSPFASSRSDDIVVQVDVQIESSTWMFRGHPIAYECQRSPSNLATKGTPVLLLNGFGMGSFHQHRLMKELAASSDEQRDIFAMDYLGQGDSWPIDCDDGNAPSEQGLRYCAETWLQQIIGFIENAIVDHPKVHLVGNSVGGHLAVFVAAKRPDLIESVVLLNATPVWGLNLPFWSGHLPAPPVPKLVGRFLFDRIREEATIREFLDTTYTNSEAYDNTLVQNVQRCTDNNGGHAAFASILWSPPLQVNGRGFYECLQEIQSSVLLCFGSDDPWCKPAFGQRMLRALEQRKLDKQSLQVYVELSSVGHCPNHEAPRATAKVLSSWMSGQTSFQPEKVREAWGDTLIQPKTADEIGASPMDRLSTMIL